MEKITGVVTSKITATKLEPLTLKVNIEVKETGLISECIVNRNCLNFLCKVASSYLITVTGHNDQKGVFFIEDFVIISKPGAESEVA